MDPQSRQQPQQQRRPHRRADSKPHDLPPPPTRSISLTNNDAAHRRPRPAQPPLRSRRAPNRPELLASLSLSTKMASPALPRSLPTSPRPTPASPRRPQHLQPVPASRPSDDSRAEGSDASDEQTGAQDTNTDPAAADAHAQQAAAPPSEEEAIHGQQTGSTFTPLFALVSDVTNPSSSTTHHPRVHYIFSDDDPDILTETLMASDPTAAHPSPHPSRAILLDLAQGADGSWNVAHASSLSSDWAVVDASLHRMEDGSEAAAAVGVAAGASTDGQAADPTRPLMLRIEGIEGEPVSGSASLQDLRTSGSGVSKSTGSGAGQEEYPALMEEFERRMGVMRRVVGAGEGRRKKAAEAEAVEPERAAEAPGAAAAEDLKPSDAKDGD